MDKDNNKSGKQQPSKKVTKEILRRRQLTALAIIALLVLIFVILIANACTDKSKKGKADATTTTTTTTTTEATEPPTEPPTTTTTAPPVPAIDPNLSAMVQISTNNIILDVGESEMPYIYGYPNGISEVNEIWTSTDPAIASVDNIGNITAVSPGQCQVVLTFNNNPAVEVRINVTVNGTAPTIQVPADIQQQQVPQMPQVTPETPDTQGSLYADTQGAQDTLNYENNQPVAQPPVAPEQPAQ